MHGILKSPRTRTLYISGINVIAGKHLVISISWNQSLFGCGCNYGRKWARSVEPDIYLFGPSKQASSNCKNHLSSGIGATRCRKDQGSTDQARSALPVKLQGIRIASLNHFVPKDHALNRISQILILHI